MSSIKLNQLLDKYGLICHTFTYNALPENIKHQLRDNNRLNYQDCFLSLIANVGPTFWTELNASQASWSKNSDAVKNPVDYFSILLTEQLVQLMGLSANAELLYPGTAPAPLISLGELAKWSTPSPLGLGLHWQYGPWFAYRALVKTSSPLQFASSEEKTNSSMMISSHVRKTANNKKIRSTRNSENRENTKNTKNTENTENTENKNHFYQASSPCLSCASRACVSACPGNAVSYNDKFNTSRCADYRLGVTSTCKEQCHARNACPVGAQYRYSNEQRTYHMSHALQHLVKWAGR